MPKGFSPVFIAVGLLLLIPVELISFLGVDDGEELGLLLLADTEPLFLSLFFTAAYFAKPLFFLFLNDSTMSCFSSESSSESDI